MRAEAAQEQLVEYYGQRQKRAYLGRFCANMKQGVFRPAFHSKRISWGNRACFTVSNGENGGQKPSGQRHRLVALQTMC